MAAPNLETLPRELVQEILLSLPTVDALSALIHASPVGYACFRALRHDILRRVLFSELGSVIRDALYWDYQTGVDFMGDADGSILESATSRYIYLLQRATSSDLYHLATPKVVINIIRHLHLLQRITNFIIVPITSEISKLDTAAAGPPSPAERGRFLQALFRCSVLLQYCAPNLETDPDRVPYYKHPCLRMFAAWELQQISDANAYLGGIWFALLSWTRRGARGRHGGRPLMPQQQQDEERDSAALCGQWRDKDAYNIRVFWGKLEDAMAEDKALRRQVVAGLREKDMRSGVVRIADSSNMHRFPGDSPVPEEAREACGSLGLALLGVGGHPDEDVARAPFAWLDALEGQRWSLWGSHLLAGGPGADTYHCSVKGIRAQEWRWFGFMFWDEQRVVQLKKLARFREFGRGWILESGRTMGA